MSRECDPRFTNSVIHYGGGHIAGRLQSRTLIVHKLCSAGCNVSANFGTRSGECLRLERNDALRRAWIVALRALFSSVSRCFGAERVQRS